MKSAASDKSRWAAALPTSSGLPSDSCDGNIHENYRTPFLQWKVWNTYLWIHLLIEQKSHQLKNPVKTIQNLWKNRKRINMNFIYIITKKLSFLHLLFPSFPIQPKSTSSVILAQASADLQGCRDFCWKGKKNPGWDLGSPNVSGWLGHPNHLQNAKYLKIPWNHCAKDPDIAGATSSTDFEVLKEATKKSHYRL